MAWPAQGARTAWSSRSVVASAEALVATYVQTFLGIPAGWPIFLARFVWKSQSFRFRVQRNPVESNAPCMPLRNMLSCVPVQGAVMLCSYSRWTKYSNPGSHRMLNPHTPNLNVSGRVLSGKVMLGVWFLSSTGTHAPQATLTLNFGGKGVVSDSKGLNISSIYGANCGVRHGPNNGELLSHRFLARCTWSKKIIKVKCTFNWVQALAHWMVAQPGSKKDKSRRCSKGSKFWKAAKFFQSPTVSSFMSRAPRARISAAKASAFGCGSFAWAIMSAMPSSLPGTCWRSAPANGNWGTRTAWAASKWRQSRSTCTWHMAWCPSWTARWPCNGRGARGSLFIDGCLHRHHILLVPTSLRFWQWARSRDAIQSRHCRHWRIGKPGPRRAAPGKGSRR